MFNLRNSFRESSHILLDKFVIRELLNTDYDKNFLTLFKQLSSVTSSEIIDYNEFIEFYNEYVNRSNKVIFVVIDNKSDHEEKNDEEKNEQIIGSISVILERKPYRDFQYSIHIEDFVIDSAYRNNGLGSEMLSFIQRIIDTKNCTTKIIYKIILDCSEAVQQFYIKNGFKNQGSYMAKYL
jgi:ribosomal protein S18 acetylase RimI-like enzyme